MYPGTMRCVDATLRTITNLLATTRIVKEFNLILHFSAVQELILCQEDSIYDWTKAISFGTELVAHGFIAWNVENCRKWGGKNTTQEETKTRIFFFFFFSKSRKYHLHMKPL